MKTPLEILLDEMNAESNPMEVESYDLDNTPNHQIFEIYKLQALLKKAAEIIKIQREALDDAADSIRGLLDNMEHYFENQCIPTADEVSQCASAYSQLRWKTAKADEVMGRNE